MAHTYKAPQRDQVFLLPPSIADWLPEDHLVWFVLDVVAMVDLAEFHKAHPNDGVGRRAYDPEMMLALLFFSYCTGLRSSRRIEAQTSCSRPMIQVLTRVYVGEESSRKELNIISD